MSKLVTQPSSRAAGKTQNEIEKPGNETKV